MLADYTFLDFLWQMLLIFAFVIWFWILITCFIDVFRRRDIGGGAKAGWLIFLIFIPALGVLVYLISQHDGMAERSTKQAQGQQAQFDDYVKSVAGSGDAASQIEKAKGLLDSGAITQAEFDQIKAKALAT